MKYIKNSHTEGKKLLKYIMVRRPWCGRGLSAVGFRAASVDRRFACCLGLFRCFCQGTHTVCRPLQKHDINFQLTQLIPLSEAEDSPSVNHGRLQVLSGVRSLLCISRVVCGPPFCSQAFPAAKRSCFQPHTRSCSLPLPMFSAEWFLLCSRVRSGAPTQSPPTWPRLPMCVPSRTASLLPQM